VVAVMTVVTVKLELYVNGVNGEKCGEACRFLDFNGDTNLLWCVLFFEDLAIGADLEFERCKQCLELDRYEVAE
jgi:hypothetical protein